VTLPPVEAGLPPKLDYDKELAVQDAVRSLIRMGLVKSAHDCAEGGLAVTLAESCISGDKMLGAAVKIPAGSSRADIPLFNESQSRIVLSVKSGDAAGVLAHLEKRGVPASRLGEVTGGSNLEVTTAGKSFSWPLAQLHEKWDATIPTLMGE